ncbi:MAG TPA: sugar phosphate isomerase/epimerase [Phnomibacter sp.]|nr:sugar phosphate isomerase/epimerase [Phnomibacter sp.]
MQRRTFIKTASLAGAGVALGAACGTPAAAPKKSPYLLGIQLYSVRDEIKNGIDSVVAKLAGMGYENIEMYGYNNGQYFGKNMPAMAALLKQHNMVSTSAHVMVPDMVYKGQEDGWKKAVEDAATLGNQYVVVPYLEEQYRKTIDGYKVIAKNLNRSAEIAKAAGLKFAYHNHAFEFDQLEGGVGYDILLKETDPALVKMELDLFWVANAGKDALTIFKQQPGRFVMWHVKDMDKADKNKQTEVGNGQIDFKAIFKAKETSGLEQFFVEQEMYAVSPYDSVEKCLAYVKKELV